MYIERKQDISIINLIEDTFKARGNFITVTDEFPTTELVIPSVSVENHAYWVKPLELGNRTGMDIRTWYIDIFANNKSQRDDFSYLIKNTLQQGIPVYDYDEGFPPDVSPTQIGAMDILQLEYSPIRVFPETLNVNTNLYWRGQVKLVARYTLTT